MEKSERKLFYFVALSMLLLLVSFSTVSPALCEIDWDTSPVVNPDNGCHYAEIYVGNLGMSYPTFDYDWIDNLGYNTNYVIKNISMNITQVSGSTSLFMNNTPSEGLEEVIKYSPESSTGLNQYVCQRLYMPYSNFTVSSVSIQGYRGTFGMATYSFWFSPAYYDTEFKDYYPVKNPLETDNTSVAYLAPIYGLKEGDECNADGYFSDCNMQKRVFHNETFESVFLEDSQTLDHVWFVMMDFANYNVKYNYTAPVSYNESVCMFNYDLSRWDYNMFHPEGLRSKLKFNLTIDIGSVRDIVEINGKRLEEHESGGNSDIVWNLTEYTNYTTINFSSFWDEYDHAGYTVHYGYVVGIYYHDSVDIWEIIYPPPPEDPPVDPPDDPPDDPPIDPPDDPPPVDPPPVDPPINGTVDPPVEDPEVIDTPSVDNSSADSDTPWWDLAKYLFPDELEQLYILLNMLLVVIVCCCCPRRMMKSLRRKDRYR